MPESPENYTYRGGKKIPLGKQPDEFTVRTTPERLREIGIFRAEPVSSGSTIVHSNADELDQQMDRARSIAPAHHAYFNAETGAPFLITDRVFVTFREPLSPEGVDAFASRYSLVLVDAYGDRDYLFQLTDHTGMNPVKLVVKLVESEPLVELAEHDLNHQVKISQFALPSDPHYARQWHLHTRLSDPSFDPRASAHCEEAWTILNGFGSAEIVVGITDDGCKLDHQDFDSPGKFAGWGYFRGTRLITNIDIEANPAEMYKTGSNHGTSCAGVIGGEVDAVLTVGAAPGCRLLPIQWESSGPNLFISDSKMLAVLNFMADKVDVMSNSWGGVPDSTWIPQVPRRITELARTGGRRGRGIVFLFAAGNENCPIQHEATVDIPYDHGWAVRPDGSANWVGVNTSRSFTNNLVGLPGVLHVAALASTAQRSHYSNYGTGILISAPSSNSHAYFRQIVPGLGITTATGATGGVTQRFGGTSSATPLVAGIAALVLSANPDLTALEVISILKRTASRNLSLQGYSATVATTFDPNTSWDISPVAPFNRGDFNEIGGEDGSWSPWFGHGRVDAAAAVAEALRRREPGQVTFRKESTPALPIPDNSQTGKRNQIRFEESAVLSEIKVEVDLSHTYIGDLRLTLIAPSGRSVVIHNRGGGNADNLQQTFDISNTPGLGALIGEGIQGDWTLWVQDLARQDKGQLNCWGLEIIGRSGTIVQLSESPGAAIPDADPAGIQRTLVTSETGRIREVEVSVDITHTFIGDLTVRLVSPFGTPVDLHSRAGGSADNLIRTYTPATLPALQNLAGEPVQGAWQLVVIDHDRQDVGKLNRWALKITPQ